MIYGQSTALYPFGGTYGVKCDLLFYAGLSHLFMYRIIR